MALGIADPAQSFSRGYSPAEPGAVAPLTKMDAAYGGDPRRDLAPGNDSSPADLVAKVAEFVVLPAPRVTDRTARRVSLR